MVVGMSKQAEGRGLSNTLKPSRQLLTMVEKSARVKALNFSFMVAMEKFKAVTAMEMTRFRPKDRVLRMKIQGSLIREQGITFGIVVVKPQVLHNENSKIEMQSLGYHMFGQVPVILMAQDSCGTPTYYGRPDIVRFLSRVPLSRIPWKEYTVA